ncbi:hypothetical protein JL193_13200 [Polaribacter batillariae]|uniref:Uncharacterized protein n=1 Tax=Polaribacter batillariae TaxID=2808900 RepID=A0ABX7SUR2_9FLAO|nr:hypothetical protein [Polaribacter batillariae]QTD37068.1 hypothetical protein JL193_13200 [Polaribacter batillariae]
MNTAKHFLYQTVEDKTIVWFEKSNEYLVLENTTADILKRINKGIPVNDIAFALSKKLAVPLEKAIDFVLDLERKIYAPKTVENSNLINDYRDIKKPKKFEYTKFYKINNIIVKVNFSTEYELYLVHPKFKHLEVKSTSDYHHNFIVFINNNFVFFYNDKKFIGAWSKKEIHFFQGKFSMELIQKIHQKEEKEWLGVFHASAVSNGKKSILFCGDSGNGKSTSLALLQANGFTCLADDFVPVDAKNTEVYSFPAAISIKKNSVKTLLPIYPELENSAEYHFKRLNKIVRYLKPNNTDFSSHKPCKDLVFIKYKENADLQHQKIAKIEAFQQLVPDAWLSPVKENADAFLKWFTALNCHQITYSNNQKMVATVSKIFKNEL